MKLLFCQLCGDVRKIGFKRTFCSCRKSSGKYLQDGLRAIYHGKFAHLIGIANPDIHEAIQRPDHPVIRAWRMDPNLSHHIEKVKEFPSPEVKP